MRISLAALLILTSPALAEFKVSPAPVNPFTVVAAPVNPFSIVQGKVEPTPQPRSPWKNYREAYTQARVTGEPLVVFANREPFIVAGAIVCREDSWSDTPAIYVGRISGATLWHRKLPADAAYSTILNELRTLPVSMGAPVQQQTVARSVGRACST